MSEAHLRVGTAQREAALEVLRNAAADERITFEELEARVPRALHAITRGDLIAVLDDLLPAAEVDHVVGGELPQGSGAGYSWDDPLVLEVDGWTELYVAHAWEVPPFLEVHASIGGVRLDFSEAIPRAKVIDLVIICVNWGRTHLIVPEGWGVDIASWQTEVSTLQPAGRPDPAEAGPAPDHRPRPDGRRRLRPPAQRPRPEARGEATPPQRWHAAGASPRLRAVTELAVSAQSPCAAGSSRPGRPRRCRPAAARPAA